MGRGAQPETYRLYNCRREDCRTLVCICSDCDAGNIYCGKKCRRKAALEAGRRKAAHFQATATGRLHHKWRTRRSRSVRRRRTPLPVDTQSAAGCQHKACCQRARCGRQACPRSPNRGAGRPQAPCQFTRHTRKRCPRGRRQPSPCLPERKPRGGAHRRRACLHEARRERRRCPSRRISCRLPASRGARRVRSADESMADVTHPGFSNPEPGSNVQGCPEGQKEPLDVRSTPPVPAGSRSIPLTCSMCGRCLPPLARLHTWRWSG